MTFSGISPDGRLVEIAEIDDHPFMVASQFHPEFLSRPNHPHPLFIAFLKAVRTYAGIDEEKQVEVVNRIALEASTG